MLSARARLPKRRGGVWRFDRYPNTTLAACYLQIYFCDVVVDKVPRRERRARVQVRDPLAFRALSHAAVMTALTFSSRRYCSMLAEHGSMFLLTALRLEDEGTFLISQQPDFASVCGRFSTVARCAGASLTPSWMCGVFAQTYKRGVPFARQLPSGRHCAVLKCDNAACSCLPPSICVSYANLVE